MLFWTIVKVALRSMLANKLRTWLTMLGIVIGVGSVIVMLALGAGTEKAITNTVSSFGANIIMVYPTSVRGGGGTRGDASAKLTLDDARALVKDAPDILHASPESSSFMQVKYYGKNVRTRVQGCATSYFIARNSPVETGREFTSEDEALNSRVCILGAEVVNNLFSSQNPVGETLKIGSANYTVIGVLKRKGDSGMFNPDDIILVPITTAITQLLGSRDSVQVICVSMRDGIGPEDAKAQITKVLRAAHKIQTDQPNDFDMFNIAEVGDQLSSMASFFKMFMAGIASVSLFVGGIGIMNIMLVSVTERTREIGIRKALGAKTGNVLMQFLLEATTISFVGGAIGVACGLSLVIGFNYLSSKFPQIGMEAEIQLWPILLSLGFAIMVGIFFGWYPARKAAIMNPIDALRYE